MNSPSQSSSPQAASACPEPAEGQAVSACPERSRGASALPLSRARRGDTLAFAGLGVLIAYAIVRNLFAAAATRFWCDEVSTVFMTRMPTLSAIWNALDHAVDGQPPLFYLIERAAGAFALKPEIAFRLPSIAAFALTLLCVFVFIRRRSGGMIAVVCAGILLLTVLFDPYAVDARPYSMMVACIALALVCYQRVPETRWTILMGLSLVAAESLHYFAVFALAAFAAAEVAFFLKTPRFRTGVWLGLACGLLPLMVCWPLLSNLRRNYGGHAWASPTLRHAGASYGWFFNIRNFYVNGFLAFLVVLLLICAALLLALPRTRKKWTANPLFHEHILILALLGLPFLTLVVAKIAHGEANYKYAMPAALAIPLGLGCILSRLNRAVVTLTAIAILCAFTVQEARFWPTRQSRLAEFVPPMNVIELVIDRAGRPDLPVVFSDAMAYGPAVYYAPPEQARRFVALADPPKAIAYTGTNNIDSLLLAQKPYYHVQAYEFRDFVACYPEFLLYSDGGYYDWWPRRLRDDGYTLQLVAAEGGDKIYLVGR